MPQTAGAHASLTNASPAPGAQLDSSPGQVVLTFNERLENKLFELQVFDQNGELVTNQPAALSENQSEISVALPRLPDGIYTVTYSVISADGHPIAESYIFSIGQLMSAQPSIEERSGSNMDGRQLLVYSSRTVYFLSLLLLVGWIFWGIAGRTDNKAIRETYSCWLLRLQRLFMLSLLFMVAMHLPEYMEEWDPAKLTTLLFGSAIGASWLSSLILSLLSFVWLGRTKWMDGLWILLVLAAKTFNGHAMAFEPVYRTIILDGAHLLAAAVWSGGLFYLVVHWRKHPEHRVEFLPKFSKFAFLSIAALTVTGISSALIFLPSIKYLQYTEWGTLFIVKCVLVVIVIIAGAILRWLLKRKKRHIGMMVKADFSLMLLIVIIASIFTSLNPRPANEPLSWHVMGESMHMTTSISPKTPGNNRFSVVLWITEGSAVPKKVNLYLQYEDDQKIAPIEVPLEPSLTENGQYSFSAEGPYLPFAGKWMVELRVLDSDDDETVYHHKIMVY
ncbi:copper resistance CopC/CopD family protein [Paenibacillus nanensis]|uniref:copper resistance CopC/CopD family protein n=1 Tax=Paenibacillus nanensis TaxID=393251 RepID=UPI0013C2DAC3|nr:copper resistance protein CopC [Paenibacillus nanensis]